jgi:hypothetical protein
MLPLVLINCPILLERNIKHIEPAIPSRTIIKRNSSSSKSLNIFRITYRTLYIDDDVIKLAKDTYIIKYIPPNS